MRQSAIASIHIGTHLYLIGTEQRFDYEHLCDRWTYAVSEAFVHGTGSFAQTDALFDTENEALIAAFTFVAHLTA